MKIVFATNNAHKLSEIRSMVSDDIEILSLKDIGCDADIPETGSTFEANSMQKARYIYDHYGMSVFADDSGLEVDALGGAPGVYSARYAGGDGHDSEANMSKLLHELNDNPHRAARFRTVISLLLTPADAARLHHAPESHFSGSIEGIITHERRGGEGFGYDPIFQPEGYDKTFAELGNDIKNTISHRARAVAQLLKVLTLTMLLLFIVPSLFNHGAMASLWKNYLSYSDIQQIEKGRGNDLYVRASNDVYRYNRADGSITTYDRTTGLNDVFVSMISYNSQSGRLVIIYDNSNIDLLDANDAITNLPDIYQKNMTVDKTINSCFAYGQYLYLAANYGISKIDTRQAVVSETYMFDTPVNKVAISGSTIYARLTNGNTMSAPLNANLIDKSNWTKASSFPSVANANDGYNEYIDLVRTLSPGGPKTNYCGLVRYINGKLYTANGFGYQTAPASLQMYDGNEWTAFETDITAQTEHRYINLFCLDVDPNDDTHVMAGGQTGLYEYRNGQFVKEYNRHNSKLQTVKDIEDNTNNGENILRDYTEVTSLIYDREGNLWLGNGYTKSSSLFKVPKDGGEWESHHQPSFMTTGKNYSMTTLYGMMIDSRGKMWFTNNNWTMASVVRYDMNNKTADVYKTFVNQDNTKYDIYYVPAIAEDRNGNIWIGTDKGAFYISATEAAANSSATPIFNQFKVPRNDGTNYADYLLSDVYITSIYVDGGNRKWFGTSGNGVYLISSDNMEEIHHFTKSNSSLISDNIISITSNEQTGEIFFGTDRGLCSYMSDATAPSEQMNKDNVYAWPNPVEPGYSGMVTINGLSFDADVKIVTASGYLVNEGRSNGGSYSWDLTDRSGKRVASGIYNVVTAHSDGSKGTVCKIAVVR